MTPTVPTPQSRDTRPPESEVSTLTLALAGLPWDQHQDAVALALLALDELAPPLSQREPRA